VGLGERGRRGEGIGNEGGQGRRSGKGKKNGGKQRGEDRKVEIRREGGKENVGSVKGMGRDWKGEQDRGSKS